MIPCRIPFVFGIGAGKVMIPRKVLPGTEIVKVVAFVIEYGIDGLDFRKGDRSGWQAGIQIGIVGGIDFQVPVKDPPEGDVSGGKLHRGSACSGIPFRSLLM